jgi:hypothetical protein
MGKGKEKYVGGILYLRHKVAFKNLLKHVLAMSTLALFFCFSFEERNAKNKNKKIQ